MYWSINTHTHACKHVFWAVVNVKTGVNVGNAAASVHEVFALCLCAGATLLLLLFFSTPVLSLAFVVLIVLLILLLLLLLL